MDCKNIIGNKAFIAPTVAAMAGALLSFSVSANVSEGKVAVFDGRDVSSGHVEGQVYCKKVRDSIHEMLKKQCLTLPQWEEWAVQAKPKLEKELAQQAYYAKLQHRGESPFLRYSIGRSKEK